MLEEISYFLIFGKPLIMYVGIITLICFLITAALSKKDIQWHRGMAITSIILAVIHAVLGVLIFF